MSMRIIPFVCAQCKIEPRSDSLGGNISLSIKNRLGSTITTLKTSIHWCSIGCAFDWMRDQFIQVVDDSNENVDALHTETKTVEQALQEARERPQHP